MNEAISSVGLRKLWQTKIKGGQMPRDWKNMVNDYLSRKKRFFEKRRCHVDAEWTQNYVESLMIAKNLGVEVDVSDAY